MSKQRPSYTTDPKNKESNVEEEEEEEDNDDPLLTSCGLGSWRPKWLQVFANPVFFMVNFLLIGAVQNMTGAYYVGSLTTLEKRFSFDSKVSGFLLIADNFSEMFLSPIVGYLGSRLNRPRLIASGELVLALSCFTTALPYFMYGPATHLLQDNDLASKLLRNETKYELCPANHSSTDCSDGNHSTIWPAVILLWMGSFLRGLGVTAYWVIGMPFIDDSVSKKSSPIYLSLISALRLLGPVGGFLLSSLCLRFFEDPFYDPGITLKDPRFIGAWWIGFIVIGVVLFFSSLPLFLFPKQFKGANVNAKDLKDGIKGVKGIISAVKRLAKNPILMFHLVGSTFRFIGLGGYHINKTKYMESQYRQSSSGASFFTGTASLLPMFVGIISGGAFISVFKPRPRIVLILMFLVELSSIVELITAMSLGCPVMEMPQTWTSNKEYTLTSGCNNNCDCTTRVFSPVCSADKRTTYFSACFAGCQALDSSTNTFSECQCLNDYGGTATTGYCQSDSDNCDKLFPYLLVLTMGSVISSTARTGNSLIPLRCVQPKDKSFAMAMIGVFLNIFAFIPYPLIFGAITDSACLIWEKTCGQQGNCWIYDQDKFRYYLHGSALFFVIIGSVFDLIIIFYSNKIENFYDEPNESEQIQTDELAHIQMSALTTDPHNFSSVKC